LNTIARRSFAVTESIEDRIAALDWSNVSDSLDARGCAPIERLLHPDECEAMAALYPDDRHFRSRIVMERHGFGRGGYNYFPYPLPALVAQLRSGFYPRLQPIANRWHAAMGLDVRFPSQHCEFIDRCHAAGQLRPTPLLLQYGADDYNCLHQDLYGEHVFPLQLAILLSAAQPRFHRRRVRVDRTAPSHAVAPGSRLATARRCGDLRRPASSGAGYARRIPGQPAAWREPGAIRTPPHARGDFS